jgi:Cu+-exporting ATPase
MLMLADCIHCGGGLSQARIASLQTGDLPFCCSGCETVHAILVDRGLDREYYSLPRRPQKQNFVSHPDFRDLDSNPKSKMDFFIEGIHCSSCLWILERLPDFCPEVQSARLDMGRSILRVIRHEAGGFSEIAKKLSQLGYPPHAIDSMDEAEARLQAQDHVTLKRIGVSAFSAMNVMVYSFSLYWGVDGTLAIWFRVLSLLVALPALVYGAWPFYQNAMTALRSRRISMDLPISLAIVGGFLESVRQTVLGTNLLYLDSITMLVTLLLLSRYTLSRLERTEGSRAGVLHALLPSGVRVGDEILLSSGDTVPADGFLISGSLELNEAFLTGESRTIRKGMLMPVWAGSLVVDGEARLKVEKTGEQTKIGELSQQVDFSANVSDVESKKSDRWASVFLGAVIGFSGLMLILFGQESLGEAIKRSLSLLIVACPCALALATPLALARGYRVAAQSKILIRKPEVLDQAVHPKHIVFDKTGTLTWGTPSVDSWEWTLRDPSEFSFYRSIIYSLEHYSRHPYAASLISALENLSDVKRIPIEHDREIPGQGIEGFVGGDRYFVGRAKKDTDCIEFWKNNARLAQIHLTDQVRPEALGVINQLRTQGYQLHILSGDSPSTVKRVAAELGINSHRGGLLPEEKASVIRELKKQGQVLMLGDGVNDLPALGAADLGIVFNRTAGGALHTAFGKAQMIFLESKLSLLHDWLNLSKDFESTMRRNLWISFAYNLTGASLAVSGWIHPLLAAVAMPLSSLSVFFSTAWGIKRSPR